MTDIAEFVVTHMLRKSPRRAMEVHETEKAEIRRRILARRKTLSPEDMERRGTAIQSRLVELEEYRRARTIHCYVSVKGEADTHRLIDRARQFRKRIVVPIVGPERRTLRHSEISSLDQLTDGPFGLLEPRREHVRPVDLSEIDLVIVPGVAFDSQGNRIGFGGGFYDNFLKEVRVPKIGLAYEFQIVDRIPVATHDRKVDKVVTEYRVYGPEVRGHGKRAYP